MSICALPDCFVSSMRIGSACALISSSLGFPLGYCRTLTAVMASPVRVIWTCTGPHCVSATEPVTVEADAPAAPAADPDAPPDEVEPELAEPSPEPVPPDPLPAAAEEEPVPVFAVPEAPGTTALGGLGEPAATQV